MANIVDLNQNFGKLFGVQKDTNPSFRTLFNLSPRMIDDMHVNQKQSFILFYNTKVNNALENNALSLMYAVVEKSNNYYTIYLTNWLNWLHGVSGALESGYSLISKLNDKMSQSDFSSLSDAACYKALNPLLSYLPNKLSNSVTQFSLFEVMRIFIKQREIIFTRDYARNVYSRIRTNLRKEYGHNYNDVVDLIKTDSLINIRFNDEILIPNTTLVSNIIYPTVHDDFLLSIIDSINSSLG